MIAVLIGLYVFVGLAAATLFYVLDLRRDIKRLLALPQAQPNKIAGESLQARRQRFLEASRRAQ